MPLEIHVNPSGDLDEATRRCEAEIFSHWFGNTRAELDQEYAPYETASVFLALTEGEAVVGAVRLIRPGPAGLKTVHDLARPPWSVTEPGIDPGTWDVATMGVLPTVRGAGPVLYHALVQIGRANRAPAMMAILDERVRIVMATVGLTFPAVPGATPAPYLGSPASVPVYTDFPRMLERQRELMPRMSGMILDGTGLDTFGAGGVTVPPLAGFVLDPVPGAQ